MGSSSNSSSSSTSQEVTDSNNQTVTASLSGANSIGLGLSGGSSLIGGSSGGGSTNVGPLSYAVDSNNPVTNTSNGASSPISASNTPADSSSGSFDWSQILIWVVGGVALWVVLRYGFKDKNA